VGLTLVAVAAGSAALFFLATAVAGLGFGGGFQGAIRSVLPLAAPHERAGVLSVVYVVSYLALGLPAVIAGFLATREGSVLATAQQYGAAVMALAALALLGALRPERPAAAEPQAAAERPERRAAMRASQPCGG
jgi:MFS family permease